MKQFLVHSHLEIISLYEVLCSRCELGKERIAGIQKAKGYDVGEEGAKNVLNKAMRKALIQFQNENSLSVEK